MIVMDAEVLKNRLRECRAEKGVSQQEVADAVHVDRRSILGYEKGSRVPSLQTAIRLSIYYGKTVNEIFNFVKE